MFSWFAIARGLVQLASMFMKSQERRELKQAGRAEADNDALKESIKRLEAEVEFLSRAGVVGGAHAFVRVRRDPDHTFVSLSDPVAGPTDGPGSN
jgi:outer membrane translocation and assembly module TamA